MLLEDFNQVSTHQLRTLNDILTKDYGVSMSFDSPINDLKLLESKLVDDNERIKLRDSLPQLNPEFSKNLLILESLRIVIEEKENEVVYDSVYNNVLETLVEYIAESIISENTIDIAGAIEVYKETGYDGYDVKEIGTVLESFFTDEDVIREAKESNWWVPDERTQAYVDKAYKDRFGDEGLDDHDWGDEVAPGPRKRKMARNAAKPGMMNRLRKAFSSKR